MDYDAIFVGGGHNALAASVILARKGWSVAVFEKNPVAGGAVQTRELTLPGFRHDVAAMNLSLFAGSPFHREFAAELAANGLEFAPADDCFASVFADDTWLGVSSDLEKTCASIARFSEADAKKWRAMVARFGDLSPHLFAMLGSAMSLRALAGAGYRAWRAGGWPLVTELAKLVLSSPRDFLDEQFTDSRLKTALASWGMHLDFPPDQAGGALFCYLEGMANQSFGMVLGRNGADTMIKALTAMMSAANCKIHTGAEVVEITTQAGRATGIVLAGGRRIKASKAVITGVAPATLCGRLLPHGSGNRHFDEAMAKYRHAPGTMMIHLALETLPDWRAGQQLKSFAYVHVAPAMAVMAQAYAQAMDGLLPARPVLVVGQPTAIDPGRAPGSKHILWIQVRVLPAEILGDEMGQITGRNWDDIKQEYAGRVLAILEEYAPGIRSGILGMAVFSPIDLERENPNLVGGDQICGSHHLTRNFLFRPVEGYANWRTPVKNLYQIGASTWPGAGVGAGSGTMLARQLAG